MKWIPKEGKDMYNLQANSFEIADGIKTDLNMKIIDTGIQIKDFTIMSFNYPENIQNMINQNAAASMIGDMGRFQQTAVTSNMANGAAGSGNSMASDMVGMMMGMNVANQMMNNMNATSTTNNNMTAGQTKPNFCPNCGAKTGEANFCPNCGNKLV